MICSSTFPRNTNEEVDATFLTPHRSNWPIDRVQLQRWVSSLSLTRISDIVYTVTSVYREVAQVKNAGNAIHWFDMSSTGAQHKRISVKPVPIKHYTTAYANMYYRIFACVDRIHLCLAIILSHISARSCSCIIIISGCPCVFDVILICVHKAWVVWPGIVIFSLPTPAWTHENIVVACQHSNL